ncbi:MAG: hypothetical protein IKX51_09490, partial [Bacteroidales bacterium]|nr:hypothetical protein [Bacteroidales bacterium]
MKKFLLTALAIILAKSLSAQINYGGEPYAFGNALPTPEEAVMPAVDVEKYMAEDEQNTDAK